MCLQSFWLVRSSDTCRASSASKSQPSKFPQLIILKCFSLDPLKNISRRARYEKYRNAGEATANQLLAGWEEDDTRKELLRFNSALPETSDHHRHFLQWNYSSQSRFEHRGANAPTRGAATAGSPAAAGAAGTAMCLSQHDPNTRVNAEPACSRSVQRGVCWAPSATEQKRMPRDYAWPEPKCVGSAEAAAGSGQAAGRGRSACAGCFCPAKHRRPYRPDGATLSTAWALRT